MADPSGIRDLDVVEEIVALAVVMEKDVAVVDFIQKLRFRIIFRVAATAREAPDYGQTARLAEGRTQVADDVLQFVAACAAHKQNLVVAVLDVPIVKQGQIG